MLVGYTIIINGEENSYKQLDALIKVGIDLRKIYQDKIENGIRSRDKYNSMLSMLQEGDIVIIPELKRLAANTAEIVEALEEIGSQGANLISLKEEWFNTTNASGALVYEVTKGIAEFEEEIGIFGNTMNRMKNSEQMIPLPTTEFKPTYGPMSTSNPTSITEGSDHNTSIEAGLQQTTAPNVEIAKITKTTGRPKKESSKLKEAILLYHEHKLSVKQIQEATGVSKATLYRYLKENGQDEN